MQGNGTRAPVAAQLSPYTSFSKSGHPSSSIMSQKTRFEISVDAEYPYSWCCHVLLLLPYPDLAGGVPWQGPQELPPPLLPPHEGDANAERLSEALGCCRKVVCCREVWEARRPLGSIPFEKQKRICLSPRHACLFPFCPASRTTARLNAPAYLSTL